MRYREFQPQQLNEVKMKLGYLRTEVAKIDARAGMEFEMVVPSAASDEDAEWEPDYDQDTRPYSIDDIINFFSAEVDMGEVNDRQALRRLREELEQDYFGWADEEIAKEWQDAAQDTIKEYLLDDEEWFEAALRDYLEGEDIGQADLFGGDKEQAIDEIIASRESAPRFYSTKEQAAYVRDHPAYEIFLRAERGVAQDLASKQAEQSIEEQDGLYDRVFEVWRDNQDMPDEEGWLRDRDMTSMQDIENNYGHLDIRWPYYTQAYNNDKADIYSVADDFRRFIGRPVTPSTRYHGGQRDAVSYVVEPDASIDADEGAGLEFVSPPLPVNEMLDDLKKVKAWAGEYGCYTNKSTGLHMNVSVPGYSMDKLDYIKLALFIGDERILKQFGRDANTYCVSAVQRIKELAAPEQVAEVMKRMRQHMNVMASKIIHAGVTSKYTSINTKDGYVEFRSPGGDWLKYDIEVLEHTLLKFVYGLSIAIDENAHRDEYAKKLYKLIAPSDTPMTNTLQYFARYSAGELPASALKSFVKHAQAIRAQTKPKPAGAPSVVTRQTDLPRGQFTGHWLIRDDAGQVLYRFGGVGNSQADANRYAIRWLTANGYGSGTEVEVVPEMA